MAGRPSDFTPEIAAEVCERIAVGRSIRSIVTDDDMPAERTIYQWLQAHEEFAQQYARARAAQADVMAEEILDIADNGTNDYVTRTNGSGEEFEAVDYDHIARSKLRVDARKWLMSKMAPKKYGDKITQEVTGANGAPLVPVINLSGRP